MPGAGTEEAQVGEVRIEESADAGIEAPVSARRHAPWRGRLPVLAAVAAGGALGACARYGAARLWPTEAGAFPWTTLWVNVAGCAAIGVLMAVLTGLRAGHRLVRPFFGTGVLGGFTTFSTYVVDVERLTGAGRVTTGLLDLAATMLGALAAVWTTARLTRRVIAWRVS
ncbi:CrcB family protein [Streptomyces misionensis]|uniref:Fluoride-specific ion channel FluC n=1 Tax=Streptomyces misionensis TaxID=67331 RepID=A0A5C6JXG1_9ACTN|nr:CrcB family protein [Streptomyces misionensis]TWV53927.1 CrcB family protein [Streptomyces misionensis]